MLKGQTDEWLLRKGCGEQDSKRATMSVRALHPLDIFSIVGESYGVPGIWLLQLGLVIVVINPRLYCDLGAGLFYSLCMFSLLPLDRLHLRHVLGKGRCLVWGKLHTPLTFAIVLLKGLCWG